VVTKRLTSRLSSGFQWQKGGAGCGRQISRREVQLVEGHNRTGVEATDSGDKAKHHLTPHRHHKPRASSRDRSKGVLDALICSQSKI
jgi:hypothetical protein